MNKELMEALDILEKEKEISKETLFEAIENSLMTACKNHFGKADNIKVTINPETGEYLRFITTLQDGDELQVYRENGELRVERVIDGKGYDVLSVLDGSSTLWTVYHGAQAWQRTATAGCFCR